PESAMASWLCRWTGRTRPAHLGITMSALSRAICSPLFTLPTPRVTNTVARNPGSGQPAFSSRPGLHEDRTGETLERPCEESGNVRERVRPAIQPLLLGSLHRRAVHRLEDVWCDQRAGQCARQHPSR